MPLATDPLQLNEVGPFGELNARPNPHGYVVPTVPPFESMLPFLARRFGRELTTEEAEAERQKAPSIVVARDAADKIASARSR
jgi:hypothetical protein